MARAHELWVRIQKVQRLICKPHAAVCEERVAFAGPWLTGESVNDLFTATNSRFFHGADAVLVAIASRINVHATGKGCSNHVHLAERRSAPEDEPCWRSDVLCELAQPLASLDPRRDRQFRFDAGQGVLAKRAEHAPALVKCKRAISARIKDKVLEADQVPIFRAGNKVKGDEVGQAVAEAGLESYCWICKSAQTPRSFGE